jgi:hypothetical protein
MKACHARLAHWFEDLLPDFILTVIPALQVHRRFMNGWRLKQMG